MLWRKYTLSDRTRLEGATSIWTLTRDFVQKWKFIKILIILNERRAGIINERWPCIVSVVLGVVYIFLCPRKGPFRRGPSSIIVRRSYGIFINTGWYIVDLNDADCQRRLAGSKLLYSVSTMTIFLQHIFPFFLNYGQINTLYF